MAGFWTPLWICPCLRSLSVEHFVRLTVVAHTVLWRCWLGGRKGIRPVKNLSGRVLAWLSVWSEVQTCIRPSWCHCHSLSLASVKSRLVLPFWYRLTRVVPENGSLNGCSVVVSCIRLTDVVNPPRGQVPWVEAVDSTVGRPLGQPCATRPQSMWDMRTVVCVMVADGAVVLSRLYSRWQRWSRRRLLRVAISLWAALHVSQLNWLRACV